MSKFVIVASIIAFVTLQTIPGNGQQMVNQCQCDKVNQCKQAWMGSVEPCVDSCKSGISSIGNYEALKACIHSKDAAIQATINCVQNAYPNACTQSGGGKMVPKVSVFQFYEAADKLELKRHFSSLKLAFGSKVSQMLRTWGVMGSMEDLLKIANSMGSCIRKCATEKSAPSDNVLVNTAIQCAAKSGFDTASMKQVCQCFVNGGVKQLAPVCPKINMNV